jgi:hypothetical protein
MRIRAKIISNPVDRASGCQCQIRNSPGFDPRLLRHSGIWGMADEAVLNYVHKGKNTKMTHKKGKKTVLGIRDFLMRIRIHRSVLVTNGSGSDSFLRDFEDREDTKKKFCIPHIFPYNLTTGTLSSVFC